MPVTELSLKPAILAGNEGVMLLLVRAPLRSDKEHRKCGLGGDMRD